MLSGGFWGEFSELIAHEKTKIGHSEDAQDVADKEQIIIDNIDKRNARLPGLRQGDLSLTSVYSPTIWMNLQESLTAPSTNLLTSMDVHETLALLLASSTVPSK